MYLPTSLHVLTAGAPSATISFTSRLDGSYILYCTITGAPPPDITWQTSSGGNTSTSLFNSSLSHTLIPVRTFLLELVPTNDLLDYTCTATSVFNGMTWTANDSILLNTGNGSTSQFSKLGQLCVMFHYPELPSVVFSSGPIVEVVHGSHVTVTCMAQGRPIPSFTWYHNEMELGSDGISVVNILNADDDLITSRVTIENASYNSHRGNYSCVARSSVGTDSALIEVVVKCELL